MGENLVAMGKVDGAGGPTPAIKGEDIKSFKGGLKVHDETGRGVDVKKVEVEGDVELRSSPAVQADALSGGAGTPTIQSQGLNAGQDIHIQQVNTQGGAAVLGSVNVEKGDFVGRDKVIQGDLVQGDKVMGDKYIYQQPGPVGNVAVGRATGMVRRVRLFVASPGDVAEERERLGRVVEQLNRGVARKLNLVVELVRWETHAVPEMGRPQQVILDQLGKEEFAFVYRLWQGQQSGWPKIMFYRCTRPPVDITRLDIEQFQKIAGFFKEFGAGGAHTGLIHQYGAVEEFETAVREHVEHWLWELSG